MQTRKPKVLLIGWDAADWRIINPLLQQGKLPGLARLMANSAWGNLVTIDPVISPMLWTSIATGKRPYKHGIHGFTEIAEDGKTARPVRVTQRTCKAVWNILNEKGYKTNVIGWWPSHPAEKLDGVCVSNFFAVPPKKDSEDWPVPKRAVYPEHMAETLAELRLHPAELTPEIMTNFFPEAGGLLSDSDPVLRSAMRILSHATSIHAAATEVMAETDWDFTAVYFDALDHFSHLGMKYHPPQLKGVNDTQFKNYHYVVEAAYRFHDMMLDRLMDLAGEDCQVMLVSDHGFESGSKRMLKLPDEPGAPALEHRPYGVFIASGEAFKPGKVYGASLLDVTPTLLNVFGLESAKDMDGAVLKTALKKAKEELIDSYETNNTTNPDFDSTEEGIDDQMIDQLVELGYINKPNNEKERQVALSENEYYLARSLADGGKLNEALAKISVLSNAYPGIERYSNFKASLLLRLGKVEELKEELLSKEETPFVLYLTGLTLLQEQKPLLAAQSFESLNHFPDASIQVKIALAWFQAGELDRAKYHATQAINIDTDEIQALNILAELEMSSNNYEEALGYLFQSLQLVYYQPKVHEQIGQCLQSLNHLDEAAQAYEVALRISPRKTSVIQRLKSIYINDKSKESRLNELDKMSIYPGIVVTGFPRSGTSLMMQILDAAAVPILSDHQREKDAFNEHGYFEFQDVKNVLVDQSFIPELPGKAVKIVFPLLRFVRPHIPLKIIWMDRELNSVLQSQDNMKGHSDSDLSFQLMENMRKERALHESWLNQYDQIEFVRVNYEALLSRPIPELTRLSNFIDLDGKIEDLAAVIKPELKHF